MPYLGRTPAWGSYEKQNITPDGSTTTFPLEYTVGSESAILVSVAGVPQEPVTAYTLSGGGSSIVFSEAPDAGASTFLIFLGIALDVPTIGPNSITNQTELAETANDGDFLLLYDTSTTSLKKITRQNLIGTVTTRTATGDGSTTNFNVTNGVTVDTVLVTENGVLQTPTTDYTVSGTTLVFSTAPAVGVAIQIRELFN
jgi:hypothetical protein